LPRDDDEIARAQRRLHADGELRIVGGYPPDVEEREIKKSAERYKHDDDPKDESRKSGHGEASLLRAAERE
jgi:hypothetical protein